MSERFNIETSIGMVFWIWFLEIMLSVLIYMVAGFVSWPAVGIGVATFFLWVFMVIREEKKNGSTRSS